MVLHVANFNYARGGLWEPIHFGRAGQIQRSGSILLGYDVFLVGALVIMGLYHVGLFALRRQDMYTLMFGLFALLLAMRSIFRGEMFIYTLLPDFPFVWHVRLEYLGFYLAMPLFLWFILLVFNSPLRRSDRAIAVLVSVLAAGFIVPVLLGDPGFFTHMVVWYQALTVVVSIVVIGAVLLPAVRAGKPGSWFAGGAFILFFAAILNDILRMNLVIHTSEMAPTGFMFFTFAQAFMLSQRSAQSYQRVERLTEANAVAI
ncbi:MAG: 7TM-DISM domain-containing protein [Spirochaeta sp.]